MSAVRVIVAGESVEDWIGRAALRQPSTRRLGGPEGTRGAGRKRRGIDVRERRQLVANAWHRFGEIIDVGSTQEIVFGGGREVGSLKVGEPEVDQLRQAALCAGVEIHELEIGVVEV